jgi:hypothetical protein
MPSSANASPAAALDLDEEFLRKPTPSLGGEWVPVPADGRFVIAPFMVMKYEARYDADTPGSTPVSGVEGLPTTDMSRTAAMAACRTLGEGFSLISHSQWMALARNIESVPANWSGAPGKSVLQQGAIGPDNGFPPSGPWGVNDSSGLALRSHALTTGDTVYDLSGNVWEHVMDVFDGDLLPYASPAADPNYYTFEYTAQVVDWGSIGKTGFGPERAWDSAQGIGTFTNTYPRSELQGKRFGLVYGGDFASGAKNGGIYAASVVPEGDEGYAKGSTGFRCVYDGR